VKGTIAPIRSSRASGGHPRENDTHAFPIVLKVLLGSKRMKAAQDPNQHRNSIFWLCLERMFVATHGGSLSRKVFFGWDGAA
jgi:hypothetical protein